MESKKIFPSSIIKNSVEVYDAKISVGSKVIYLMILFGFFGVLFSLPLIFVDVAIQSPGTLQSSLQRNNIVNTVNGRIDTWNLSENSKVEKGDVLAVIRGEKIHLEMEGLEERLSILNDFLADLRELINLDLNQSYQNVHLKSRVYQSDFFEFESQVINQKAILEKQERDFVRAKLLFENKSIAFVEYDEAKIQLQQVKSQLELLKKKKFSTWENELVDYSYERDRILNQIKVSEEQLDQYKVIAGVSGTLINVLNLNPGDFLYPNQKIAEISPDSDLMAVTYISPADIAFLRKGQEVILQIDAFNYNQWGVARAVITEIADDLIFLPENKTGFLVTCQLESLDLELPTGQKGQIKKGMTFNARFIIARRSLFQLLYDKVDNWMNPAVSGKN